ncbi:hypothetical protein R3W88_024202 [Solanum pinnatisectum]|uniref:Uncharacterized protein n=1 Tax=Solanum pinnatisectum TaxID=50273 RepID=A0AAV9LZU4_9SOLN|nr:hypothetical protein R3W88_024202 [Solanum pinnatisectum]
MMNRFDATDENVKEMQNDLCGIGQKIDAHAVSIKKLEQQFNQLSTNANPRQPDTLPSNTIQNLKNDGHCMTVTIRGGKQTIDPPMPSEVEKMVKKDEDEIEFTDGPKDNDGKEVENDERMKHCSAIATRSLVQKKEDPGAFTIPCTIGVMHFAKLRRPIGVLQDVLVKVESFIFPTDFVILDCEVDFEVPIILGRPFLAIGRSLVDIEKGLMKLRLNNEEVTFNICRSIKQESALKAVSVVNLIMQQDSEVSIEEKLGVDALAVVMMNFDSNKNEDYDELVAALDRFEFCSKPKRLEFDMKNRDSPSAKPSVDKPPKLDLKALPPHLRYVFLGKDKILLVS